jgi:hypothetical protein
VTVKATINFTSPDGGQWSEDYFINAMSASSVAFLDDNAIGLRLLCLADNATMRHIRYATVGASRDVNDQDVEQKGQRTTSTQGPAPSDWAVVYKIKTGPAPPATRKLWLRGLAAKDLSVRADGLDVVNAGLTSALNDWLANIGGKSWGIRRLTPTKLVPPNVAYISSVDGSVTPGISLITTTTPHGLAAGSNAIIYRTSTKDLPGLRGAWPVITIPTPTTFTVAYRTPRDQGPIAAGGFVRNGVYDNVVPFTRFPGLLAGGPATVLHIAHHDTKDVFFGSRGAKRAAKTRHSP